MSLWALGKNRAVSSVDQDGIDAMPILDTGTEQVFAKTERNGDAIVGLSNTGSQPEVISTTAQAIGLPAQRRYLLRDLWTHECTEATGTISGDVSAHGVALFRVSHRHHWW